jgi:hypothetical protein
LNTDSENLGLLFSAVAALNTRKPSASTRKPSPSVSINTHESATSISKDSGGVEGWEEKEGGGVGVGGNGEEQPDWKVTAVRDFQLSPSTIAHIVLVQRVAGASTGLVGGGGEGVGDRGDSGYLDAVSQDIYRYLCHNYVYVDIFVDI